MKFIYPLLACLIWCTGCNDPTSDELAHGADFDPSLIHGVVTDLEMKHFQGDRDEAFKGKVYYVVKVQNQNDSSTVEWKGVPEATFRTMSIGLGLPTHPVLDREGLTQIQGVVIKKFCDPAKSQFGVVVQDASSFSIYYVEITQYFTTLVVGTELPLPIPLVEMPEENVTHED